MMDIWIGESETWVVMSVFLDAYILYMLYIYIHMVCGEDFSVAEEISL